MFTKRHWWSWYKLRKKFLQKNNKCSCCGTIRRLQVHHIKPVHLFPDKELEYSNLKTLCKRCHLFVGHLGNWKLWNRELEEDIKYWKMKNKKAKYILSNLFNLYKK